MRKQTTLKSNTQDGVVQPLTSNLTLSVYRESMAKLEESWLTVNWYIDSLFL